jgi:hypothetical protein
MIIIRGGKYLFASQLCSLETSRYHILEHLSTHRFVYSYCLMGTLIDSYILIAYANVCTLRALYFPWIL